MTVDGSAIDFARSSVTWLLLEQPSHGRFAIDAALTLADGETFYLGAQVFAGDVYGEGPLFRDPPYGFCAAFSSRRYRIFRDAARGASQEDSQGPLAQRFRAVEFDVVRAPARILSPAAVKGAFCARMRAHGWVLEFPVRHLNWREDGRYQAETGPVLAIEEGAADSLDRLRRAYVIFSSPERAELLMDAPRPSTPGQRWQRRLELRCTIELLQMEL